MRAFPYETPEGEIVIAQPCCCDEEKPEDRVFIVRLQATDTEPEDWVLAHESCMSVIEVDE